MPDLISKLSVEHYEAQTLWSYYQRNSALLLATHEQTKEKGRLLRAAAHVGFVERQSMAPPEGANARKMRSSLHTPACPSADGGRG